MEMHAQEDIRRLHQDPFGQRLHLPRRCHPDRIAQRQLPDARALRPCGKIGDNGRVYLAIIRVPEGDGNRR